MINKFGSQLIDLLFHSLLNMKGQGIRSVTFDVPNDTISVADSEGTLILRPNQYANPDEIAHYNYINSIKVIMKRTWFLMQIILRKENLKKFAQLLSMSATIYMLY